LQVNPFLRLQNDSVQVFARSVEPDIKTTEVNDQVSIFAALRRAKDHF
jgi:hypothetical protein